MRKLLIITVVSMLGASSGIGGTVGRVRPAAIRPDGDLAPETAMLCGGALLTLGLLCRRYSARAKQKRARQRPSA